MSIMILAVWIATGCALAAAIPDPDSPRLGMAPLAAFLGPLWLPVALDRRRALAGGGEP